MNTKSDKNDVQAVAAAFNHHSTDIMSEPFEMFRAFRERCPVAHSEQHGGFWMLSRYEDVFNAALDYETFSSADGVGIPKQSIFPMYPIDIDPPEQTAFRRLLNPKFEPLYVSRLEPFMQEVAHALIDGVIGRGECDIAQEVCFRFPAVASLTFIGVPEEDRAFMAHVVHDLIYLRDEAAASAARQHRDYIFAMVEARRRAEPQDDVLSALIDGELSGRHLDTEEIYRALSVILFGGLDTTASVMINALWIMDQQPAIRHRLLAEPELWDTAVEEFVRLTSPNQALKRILTCDTTLHGVTMPRGDNVMLLWGSACRDAEKFDAADDCRIDRSPNRHLGFGIGAHKCLGIHFARASVKNFLMVALERLPDYRVVEGFVPEYACAETRTVKRLPIRFTPGPPRNQTKGDV